MLDWVTRIWKKEFVNISIVYNHRNKIDGQLLDIVRSILTLITSTFTLQWSNCMDICSLLLLSINLRIPITGGNLYSRKGNNRSRKLKLKLRRMGSLGIPPGWKHKPVSATKMMLWSWRNLNAPCSRRNTRIFKLRLGSWKMASRAWRSRLRSLMPRKMMLSNLKMSLKGS